MRLRRHNQPDCPCPYPIACGLTPRWLDEGHLPQRFYAVAGVGWVGYGFYEAWQAGGWLGIVAAVAVIVAMFVGMTAWLAIQLRRDRLATRSFWKEVKPVTRYRMVTVQNGKEHVSTVVNGVSEVGEALRLEAILHLRSGWSVTIKPEAVVVARRDGKERTIFFREYDAMGDYESA